MTRGAMKRRTQSGRTLRAKDSTTTSACFPLCARGGLSFGGKMYGRMEGPRVTIVSRSTERMVIEESPPGGWGDLAA